MSETVQYAMENYCVSLQGLEVDLRQISIIWLVHVQKLQLS